MLNDLWIFDGSNWTWVSGTNEIDQRGNYGTKRVPNPSNFPGGRKNANLWCDSSNNLYLFGGTGYSSDYSGIAYIHHVLIIFKGI